MVAGTSDCFYGMGGMGRMMSHGMNFGLGGLVPLIFQLLLLILIGLAIYLAFRRLSGTPVESTESSSDDPLEILERRYARGEIDREEYNRKKEDLT